VKEMNNIDLLLSGIERGQDEFREKELNNE